MKHFFFYALLSTSIFLTASITAEENIPSEISVIATYHCLSLYWSPTGGSAERKISVKYRKSGQPTWRTGLPLRFHPIDTPECKADYRGSLVNLSPATSYEIELSLEGTETRKRCTAATWNEVYPVKNTIKADDRNKTLNIDKSGTPDGYVLYDGTGATIDTANEAKHGIEVSASYVIIRGFKIRNTSEDAIRIMSGHHIIIEDCDISQWGSKTKTGFGKNYQAGVYSNSKELHSVTIQRCSMHHPSQDSNSWAEKNRTYHPEGPQCIVFFSSGGNHVIRYNEFWSDKEHYYNDILGAGRNGSYRGFPGPDSDIYCNFVADCWDDGIEVEGDGQNIRVWNNYIENYLQAIANAAISIGPLYIWRNVSGASYSPTRSQWNLTHGNFLKMGHAGGIKWMSGTQYIFNNTIFQGDNNGANGLGGNNRIIRHCTSRNNIIHVRKGDKHSISISKKNTDNDFNYDLVSALHPPGQEKNAIKATPRYVKGAGFDRPARSGIFQLAPESRGFDKAHIIPNFCEIIDGNHPDMGAHESGTGVMQFGVKAEFIPPQP